MKPTQSVLAILPVRDIVNRIALHHVIQANVMGVQDIVELLITMWLRDRHFSIHGEYIGTDVISTGTLEERIKAEVFDLLIIDVIYIVEPTLLSSVISDVAHLLFNMLETLFPEGHFCSNELPNVRVVKWVVDDLVIEMFE